MKKLLLLISITLSLYATSINDFINLKSCGQIIDKQIYRVCYDYKLKAARAVWYQLDRQTQELPKIHTRPKFYSEKTIPVRYRAKYKDYTHSGYDRGHLANNWDFAYDKKLQRKTFSLVNIVPQSPIVNRKLWEKAERYERSMALKLGNVSIINLVKYSNNPDRIGKNGIAVPNRFFKIIYNDQKNFKRCFSYGNDLKAVAQGDKLKLHLINCKEVR